MKKLSNHNESENGVRTHGGVDGTKRKPNEPSEFHFVLDENLFKDTVLAIEENSEVYAARMGSFMPFASSKKNVTL